MDSRKEKIKIILFGDDSIKEKIFQLYRQNTSSFPVNAIGIDCISHPIEDKSFQIWNVAGSQRFERITTSFFKGAHSVIFCPKTSTELKELTPKIERKEGVQYLVAIDSNDKTRLYKTAQENKLETVALPTADNLNNFLLAVIDPRYRFQLNKEKSSSSAVIASALPALKAPAAPPGAAAAVAPIHTAATARNPDVEMITITRSAGFRP
jgi:hypothetical protein